jgi:hypothetical protein
MNLWRSRAKAAPARSPIQDILWEAGWGSGLVPLDRKVAN